MPTFTFECASESQLAALQQAALFLAEMARLAQSAPAGEVLHRLEGHALDAGRQLLRDSLQAAAQQRIDHGEQKGATPAAARAPARAGAGAGIAVT
jgi:hypothetical protein